MKTFILRAVMGMAVAACWQTAIWAGAPKWVIATDAQEAAETIETPAPAPKYLHEADQRAGAGDDRTDAEGDCEPSPVYLPFRRGPSGCGLIDCPTLVGLFGLDSFKGVSDDGLSNFGAVAGLNSAVPAPLLRQYGLGWQLGATYGVYDFEGRPGTLTGTQLASSEQQVFVTTGLFCNAWQGGRLSFGLVYDWMIADDWGIVPTPTTLMQWRGQVEYGFNACDSIGVWGCIREGSKDHDIGFELFNGLSLHVPVTTRAINQLDVFWRHKFPWGAEGRIWLGFPEQARLDERFGGSLGEWIFGADFQVPLSDSLALYANVQYMKPSAESQSVGNFPGSLEESYNIGMGIMWYPGRSQTATCGGQTPYMPVANNSTFLVDQRVGPVSLGGGGAD